MSRRKRKTGKVQQRGLTSSSNTTAVIERPGESAPLAAVTEGVPSAAGQGAIWRVVAAAAQGVSHARLDLPCQDVTGYRQLDSGLLVIALADGAGSARCAEQGARLAVDETLRVMGDSLAEDFPQDAVGWHALILSAFDSARQAVVQMAEEAGDVPRDYASTLTGVILTPDQVIAGQIGDGAVIAEAALVPAALRSTDDEELVEAAGESPDGARNEPELFAVTHLQRGEYANETHFLVEEDALEQAVIEMVERPVRAVAVMSDGLIRLALKMPSQDPHAPFFQPLFRFVKSMAGEPEAAQQAEEQLAAFLNSERVNARTDDDKSLVLAARVQDEA